MLPSINTEQWSVLSNNRVLVGICADLDLACLGVLHEPCPAASLDTGKSSIEFGLERGEVAVAGFNGSLLYDID